MEVVKSTVGKAAVPLAFTVGALFASGIWIWLRGDIGMDFGVYWRAAAEPLEVVYSPREYLNFPYPPTMLLWVAPLAIIPKGVAFGLWTLAGAIGLAIACRKHLQWREIGLVLISPPALYCFLQGQVSVGLAALLVWACSTRNNVLCGVLFAVVASIKPHFVVMAPIVIAATRNWQAAVAGSLAFLSIVAASVLAFGIETYLAWVRSLDHFNYVVQRNGVLQVTITPAGFAQLVGVPAYPVIAMGAVYGAVLAYLFREAESLAKAAAIATGSLLAAPYAVSYDLVVVVPFLVSAIFRGRILATVAYATVSSPLALLLTAFELHSAKKTDHRPAGDVSRE